MPAIVIHHYAQARRVLAAAACQGAVVILVSPEATTVALGAGFFHQIGCLLKHPVLIDCGSDLGTALAAIECRNPKIRADCRPDVQRQLQSMCDQVGIRFVRDLPAPLIKLDSDDLDDEIMRAIV